mgnify:CR=1 FL=1
MRRLSTLLLATAAFSVQGGAALATTLFARFRYALVRVAASLELPPFLLPNEAAGPVVVDAVLRGGVSRAPATVDAK